MALPSPGAGLQLVGGLANWAPFAHKNSDGYGGHVASNFKIWISLNIIWRFPKMGVPHGTMVFGDPLQSITARPSLEADEMGIIQWFLNLYGGIYWDMILYIIDYGGTIKYIYIHIIHIYIYMYIYNIVSCFPKKRNLTWCFHHILFSDTHQHVPKKWPWDQQDSTDGIIFLWWLLNRVLFYLDSLNYLDI